MLSGFSKAVQSSVFWSPVARTARAHPLTDVVHVSYGDELHYYNAKEFSISINESTLRSQGTRNLCMKPQCEDYM